jgi:hypothetical protein
MICLEYLVNILSKLAILGICYTIYKYNYQLEHLLSKSACSFSAQSLQAVALYTPHSALFHVVIPTFMHS